MKYFKLLLVILAIVVIGKSTYAKTNMDTTYGNVYTIYSMEPEHYDDDVTVEECTDSVDIRDREIDSYIDVSNDMDTQIQEINIIKFGCFINTL